LREIDRRFIATMLSPFADAGQGAKLSIAESDVEDYPGMVACAAPEAFGLAVRSLLTL